MNPAKTKSILLVDDEKSYNDLMRQLLADNLECPVHGFTRPADALKVVSELDPAVIVTDYSMPELNGIEFIRQAAPLAPRAAFVMISGNNLSTEADRLERLTSLKAVLAKPFGWRKLADEIIRAWPDRSAAPRLRAEPP